LGDVCFVTHRDEQEVTSFFRFANAENSNARRNLGQLVVVTVNVLRIGENVGSPDDVSEIFSGVGTVAEAGR
jgi:hypothetical protein